MKIMIKKWYYPIIVTLMIFGCTIGIFIYLNKNFNKQEIIIHHYWQIYSQAEVFNQLQEQLQTCIATLAIDKLHQFIIASPYYYFEWIKQYANEFPYPIHYCANFFSQMKFSQFVNPNSMEEKYPQLLVSCGAALRDVSI